MGNCQATDAAAAVVEHPAGGRTERLYWPISARQVMLKYPGHYVAVYAWPTSFSDGPVKPKLKLWPPTAMLSVGNCYRIVSFEEVLGEVSETTHGKLLKFRNFKSDSKERFFLKKLKKICHRKIKLKSSEPAEYTI
ncbi:hypothetical protein O6H91_10G070400 [Diphasiastrum complanatum]|uniref:Uncharacterized protein n=1 Tax=Diphasiastrum complanatum TaxID=34168 RepID=A0ACC2CI29_DIPCM|nr:hypothetical protein O6H91_10G070400 [Diphasiastrum complanatum]